MDIFAFNPETDLELEKVIAASPANVWRCLTEPALIEQWFCPKPWQAHDVVLEPRPGGAFHTPMRGPNGEAMDEGPGCILVVEPERMFAFTDAMAPGFHPTGSGFMTGVYMLAPTEAGTKVTARSLHANVDARTQHAEMGFFEGWGTAIDQLEALAGNM
jgi:uncharacterized protein YndB with AHSA1/START domain